MLFQGSALFDSLRVWENVAFGLIQGAAWSGAEATADRDRQAGRGRAWRRSRRAAPGRAVGRHAEARGLARAIAAEPEIIFFDEPTTGLDPIMADVINDLIVKCVRELGATALSITHDMASARKIADRIAMLHKGKIIWQGPVGEIDHSGNPYVDQFIHGRAEGPIQMEVRAL
jgi:phospholipid/cholesterol/gamma-HCH transport system ATP-binding protein